MNSRFPLLAARVAAARAHRRRTRFLATGPRAAIVLVGSSTTSGSGAHARRISYASILGRRFAHAMHDVRIVNLGQPGTTAATYLPDERVRRIHGLAPAAVIHMVGSNDYARSVPPAEYGRTLRERLDRIDEGLALPCQHVLIQTFARIDVTAPVAPWAAYGEELRAIAADDPRRVVVDVSAAFEAVGVGFGGRDPLGLIGPDRIHMNDSGHRLMAELVWAELR